MLKCALRLHIKRAVLKRRGMENQGNVIANMPLSESSGIRLRMSAIHSARRGSVEDTTTSTLRNARGAAERITDRIVSRWVVVIHASRG
jgi:hypothetical protein